MRNVSNKLVKATFGNRLKQAREARFETAQEFAAVIGIEPHTYRKYERGESDPPLQIVGRMALALGVSTDYLILGRVT